MFEIDARGLDCPAPVIKVKKTVESELLTDFTVLLNSDSSKENVSRLLKTLGFNFEIENLNDEYTITASKGEVQIEKKMVNQLLENKNTTIFISSEEMGSGSDELGKKLMTSFIKTIKEVDPLPKTILFVNSGVFHTTKNSESITALKELSDKGVDIYSCGACLEHFGLMDKLALGDVGDMLTTTEALFNADKVIKL